MGFPKISRVTWQVCIIMDTDTYQVHSDILLATDERSQGPHTRRHTRQTGRRHGFAQVHTSLCECWIKTKEHFMLIHICIQISTFFSAWMTVRHQVMARQFMTCSINSSGIVLLNCNIKLVIFKLMSRIDIISCAFPVKLSSGKCHKTSLM